MFKNRYLGKLSLFSKLSLAFLAGITFCALFAPWIAPFSYEEQDTLQVLASPSLEHWMGTDRLGRDLFSRLIYGARVSLFIGIVTTFVALVIGTLYGAVSGYVGGRTDSIMMRMVDVVFALPDLLMIILIMVVMGRGVTSIFIALTMVSWVTVARLVRGEVLRIKQFAFIEAARAVGSSHSRILFQEILPNLWGILTLTFRIPVAILAESTLSFIGIGIDPPASSWGTLASDGWVALKFYPHLIIFPSLAIFLTILSFNFLGEGLRDFFDPRGRTQLF